MQRRTINTNNVWHSRNIPPHHHNAYFSRYRENNLHKFTSYNTQNGQSYYNFWCETCDKGFVSLDYLNNHKQQHQKCNIDGCQFVAHPRIITKHIQMQHSTGLYHKISKLNNPEEIKKWREERKRKYPTKENIEKKAAELKEKIKRGEKIGLKYNRLNRKEKPDFAVRERTKFQQPKHKIVSNKNPNSNNMTQKKPPLKRSFCEILNTIEEPRTLKPFTGIQQIVIEDVNDEPSEKQCHLIEDDEFIEESPITVQVNRSTDKVICGALTSLLCNYGSSDDDDDIETDAISNKKLLGDKTQPHQSNILIKANDPNINKDIIFNDTKDVKSKLTEIVNQLSKGSEQTEKDDKISQKESEDDSGPEEIKVIKKIEEKEGTVMQGKSNVATQKKENLKKREINQSKHVHYKNFKKKLPSTLLQKLLYKEINHERNVVLQCVRYIIKKNYFDRT